MSKTEFIRARIEPQLKDNVEIIFDKLGLTTTEAVTLFYKQIVSHKGLPFDVKMPNAVTKRAISEAKKKKKLKSFNSTKELFKELNK